MNKLKINDLKEEDFKIINKVKDSSNKKIL